MSHHGHDVELQRINVVCVAHHTHHEEHIVKRAVQDYPRKQYLRKHIHTYIHTYIHTSNIHTFFFFKKIYINIDTYKHSPQS